MKLHIRHGTLLCLLGIIFALPSFGQNTFGPFSLTGTGCQAVAVDGQSQVAMNISGSWSGTIQPEAAIAGQSAANVQIVPSTSSTAASTITANGLYTATVAGYETFFLCGNTVTGTATIYFSTTQRSASGRSGSGGGGSGVTSFSGDGTIFSNSASTGDVTATLANTVTGTGGVVLQTSPSLITPNIGSATGKSLILTDTSANSDLTLQISPQTAVVSSPLFTIGAAYQNAGTPTFAADTWTIQSVIAAGTNGQSKLAFIHAGSTSTTDEVNLFSDGIRLRNGIVLLSASGTLQYTGRATLASPADGIHELLNAAQTGYTRLDFGGTTSSFPALGISGTTITAQLADGTAGGTFAGSAFTGTSLALTDTAANTDLSVSNTTAATSSVNQSSPLIKLAGTYWTGAASAPDFFTIQNILANGTNPLATLSFAHSGSSGAAYYLFTGKQNGGNGIVQVNNGGSGTDADISFKRTDQTQTWLFGTSTSLFQIYDGGTVQLNLTPGSGTTGGAGIGNFLTFGTSGANNADVTISRVDANTLAIGTTTVGNASKSLNLLNLTASGAVSGATFASATNCAGVGTAASPSIVTCTAAAAGAFSCATNASASTCTVNTTAVTANSEIFVTEVASEGTRLSVTCNTAPSVVPAILVASKGTGTFTINMPTIAANPACFDYHVVN